MSDNDLTVLFRRTSAFVARQVSRPKPAPAPPASRRAPRSDMRERPTPLAMTVAPQAPVETVVIEPGVRERAVPIAIFLTLGCLLGVGVERVVHPEVGAAHGDATALVAAARSTASKASDVGGEARRADPGAGDRRAAPAAHHHTHHAAIAMPTPAQRSPLATSPVDAGAGADDFAAAVDALTKAKAEETLP